MDFREHSIQELVNKVKNKEISARELTESALSNIEKYDKEINAFCALIRKMLLIKPNHWI